MENKDDDFIINDLEEDLNISSEESLSDNIFTEPLETEEINTLENENATDKKEKGKKESFLINRKGTVKEVDINDKVLTDSSNNSSLRSVVIDFLEGTSKKSEAMTYARGFIDNHYSSPESCYIYLLGYEGSYAIEIQDGGNRKPYLPNVIKTLEEDPEACVCIQNKRRILEIKRDLKGIFSAVLLPEGADSTETNIVRISPSETAKMRPYSINTLLFSVISLGICIFSFIFLLLTSVAALISYNKPVKALPVTNVRNLPILQWTDIIDKYEQDKYIEKVTYLDDRWKIAQRKIPLITVEGYPEKDADNNEFYSLSEEEKAKISRQVQEEVIKDIKSPKKEDVKEEMLEDSEEIEEDFELQPSRPKIYIDDNLNMPLIPTNINNETPVSDEKLKNILEQDELNSKELGL